LLTLLPWVGLFIAGGGGGDPSSDPAGFARSATSPAFTILGDLYIIGLICLIFGVLAIYALLADTPGNTWAALGMVLGVSALALVVGIWTILTYADAVVGDVYLSGHQDIGETFKSMSGGHWSARFIPFFVVVGLTGLISSISLGVAIWRSGRFAKWVAIVFGVAFLLSVVSAPWTLIGAILLIITGIMIAREESRPAVA
jgi:hypothetical protein